jgi:hypothetical protein
MIAIITSASEQQQHSSSSSSTQCLTVAQRRLSLDNNSKIVARVYEENAIQ